MEKYNEVSMFNNDDDDDDVDFPTLVEVEAEGGGGDGIIPWKLVKKNIVYRIVDSQDVVMRNGSTLILTLKDVDGEIVKCYTTSIIERDLRKNQKNRNDRCVYFITSFGLNFKITTRQRKK